MQKDRKILVDETADERRRKNLVVRIPQLRLSVELLFRQLEVSIVDRKRVFSVDEPPL